MRIAFSRTHPHPRLRDWCFGVHLIMLRQGLKDIAFGLQGLTAWVINLSGAIVPVQANARPGVVF